MRSPDPWRARAGRQAPRQSGKREPARTRSVTGLPLLGAVGVLVAIVAVETRLVRLGGVGPGRYRLLGLILAWWGLLAAAGWLVCRVRPRGLALLLILAGTLALQGAALTRDSQISDDLYRYAWDGQVQAAGVDPYAFAPQDERLAGVRDPWLWPDAAACRGLHRATWPCTRINRPAVHTIYPPVAEAWFLAVHLLPGGSRDHHQQLYADLVSLLLLAAIVALARRLHRDPRLAVLYAWSPVVGLDIASDAHVDVLAALVGLAGLAVLLHQRGGRRAGGALAGSRGAALGGALIGAAVAVKLYPVLLLPAAVRRRPLAVGGAAAATVAGVYLPHLLAVGPDVIGYLPGYLAEEHYSRGSRFLLLRFVGLQRTPAQVVAVVLVLALAVAVLRTDPRRVPVTRAALWTVGGVMLVAAPVQPWYSILLLTLAVVEARPEWLAVCAAAYPLYVTSLINEHKIGTGMASYGTAALVVLLVSVLRHRRAAGWDGRRPAAGVPAWRTIATRPSSSR